MGGPALPRRRGAGDERPWRPGAELRLLLRLRLRPRLRGDDAGDDDDDDRDPGGRFSCTPRALAVRLGLLCARSRPATMRSGAAEGK
jgi:hypothetical protein